jgi:glycosyltransferase involved in cell wall biosynthesis
MDHSESWAQAPRVLELLGSGALGGGTTHVFQLLDGLPERGFRVALAVDPEGPALEAARRRGLDAIPVAFARGRLHPAALRDLRAALRQIEPQLVHAHGSRAALVAAALTRTGAFTRTGALGDAALLYSEHGLARDVPRRRAAAWLARAAERACVRAARRTLVASEYARDALAALAPGAASRLRLLPNAVGAWRPTRSRERVRAELSLAPEQRVVGCVARLVPQKGLADLVAAAARTCAAEPRAVFVVVGGGPLRASLESAAARTQARIRFLGERDDVADLLGAFDVFALASHWEGTPISILEAMSAGLPVVATRVGGVPGLVDDATGVLVAPRAPQSLADALIALLADPATARRLGESGRARALARHGVGTLLDGVARCYREALAGA